jgi:hypothetical protein
LTPFFCNAPEPGVAPGILFPHVSCMCQWQCAHMSSASTSAIFFFLQVDSCLHPRLHFQNHNLFILIIIHCRSPIEDGASDAKSDPTTQK